MGDRKTAGFDEFKAYTIAVARGDRTVDPAQPKIWVEPPAGGENSPIGNSSRLLDDLDRTEIEHAAESQIAASKKKRVFGFTTELLNEPMEEYSTRRLLLHLLHLKTGDVTLKWIFDNIKNSLVCGAICWIGVSALRSQERTIADTYTQRIAGTTLIVLSLLLISLNYMQIFVAISRLKRLNLFSALVCGIIMLLVYATMPVILLSGKPH